MLIFIIENLLSYIKSEMFYRVQIQNLLGFLCDVSRRAISISKFIFYWSIIVIILAQCYSIDIWHMVSMYCIYTFVTSLFQIKGKSIPLNTMVSEPTNYS